MTKALSRLLTSSSPFPSHAKQDCELPDHQLSLMKPNGEINCHKVHHCTGLPGDILVPMEALLEGSEGCLSPSTQPQDLLFYWYCVSNLILIKKLLYFRFQ